jgi:hypothetical protein
VTLLAEQTALWLTLGLAAGVGVLILTIALVAMFAVQIADFAGDSGAVADVQRFIELTDEARALVPRGRPLFDREEEAATVSAAIVRFQAKKEEARHALWASSERHGLLGSHSRVASPRLTSDADDSARITHGGDRPPESRDPVQDVAVSDIRGRA